MGEKVQGIRSINGRYKIDKGRLRKYRKWRNQRTYIMPRGQERRRGMLVGWGAGGEGKKNWDNYDSIINKIYLKKGIFKK